MISGKVVVIGVGALAGLAALLLMGGSAHAADNSELSDVQDRVSKALATHDPGIMRGEADALEREGFHEAAVSLRAEADKIDPGHTVRPKPPTHPQAVMSQQGYQAASQHKPKPGNLPGHTSGGYSSPAPSGGFTSASPGFVPQPQSQGAPTVLPPVVVTGSPSEDPNRALAQQVTTMLIGIGGLSGRGQEDKTLIEQFQGQEKLTKDGNYGPGTATRILQRYGIVPVVPFYWSKSNWKAQKKAFTSFVRSYATGDPDRRDQYNTLISDTQRS